MLLLFIISKCLFIYLLIQIFLRYYRHKILKFLKIENQIKPTDEFLLPNIKLKNIKKIKLLKNPEIYCLHEDFLRTNDKQSIRSNIDFLDIFTNAMLPNPDIAYSDPYNHELFTFSDSLSRLTSNPYLLHETVAELRAFDYSSVAYFEYLFDKHSDIEDSQDLVREEYNIEKILDEDEYVDPEWNTYFYDIYVDFEKYDGDYYFNEFRDKYFFENYYEGYEDIMGYEEYASDDLHDEAYVDDYNKKIYYGYDLSEEGICEFFYYDENMKKQDYYPKFDPDYEYCDYEFYACDLSVYEDVEYYYYTSNSRFTFSGKHYDDFHMRSNIYISPLIVFSDEYLQLLWRGRTLDEAFFVFSYPDYWYKKGIFLYNIDINSKFSECFLKKK